MYARPGRIRAYCSTNGLDALRDAGGVSVCSIYEPAAVRTAKADLSQDDHGRDGKSQTTIEIFLRSRSAHDDANNTTTTDDLLREDSAYVQQGLRKNNFTNTNTAMNKKDSGPSTPPNQELARGGGPGAANLRSHSMPDFFGSDSKLLWERRNRKQPQRLDVRLQVQLGVIESPTSFE